MFKFSRLFLFFWFSRTFFCFLGVFLFVSKFVYWDCFHTVFFCSWWRGCIGRKGGPKVEHPQVEERWTKGQKHVGTTNYLGMILWSLKICELASSWLVFPWLCCMHHAWIEHASFQNGGHRLHCPQRVLCCAFGPRTTWWSHGALG